MEGPTIEKSKVYDFLFIGLGACNSLILLSLLKKKCLLNKEVAIIEADDKDTNDKTYCFWAAPSDSIVLELASIISHSYTKIEVNQSTSQNIEDQPYHYIKSIDLYNYTQAALKIDNATLFRDTVNHISSEGDIYSVSSKNTKYLASYIFDSRPPSLSDLGQKEIYLHQSFYGLHIKCENEVFNEDEFEMMNFQVEQYAYTQFIYILPFSKNEALVELTRFGKKKIDVAYAKEILNKIISKDYGNYEVLADEDGCIPMTTFRNSANSSEGILHTGARANLIKPSTGYAFKKMHAFANKTSEEILKGNYKEFNKLSLETKKRFRLYDRLLLIILLYWPGEGKKIFTQLYKKQGIHTIFSFLDEKTTLLQELKIFAFLPILPFLKAVYIFFKKYNYLRYIIAFLAVVIYWVFDYLTLLSPLVIGLILIPGFLYVGIPHGALDHILIARKEKTLLQFCIKYILIMGIYFIVWQFFPMLSLLFFILFSAFHFGESELEEDGWNLSSLLLYGKAYVFGMCILLFIIFTHPTESQEIISLFNVNFPLSLRIFDQSIYAVWIASISFLYILIQTTLSKKYRHFGLLFLLVLGIKTPLILAFGLYFIFQHSLNAWGHLKHGLKMDGFTLYKKALPFTLSAIFFLCAMLIYNSVADLNLNKFIAILFIFLSCISLPHFLLMHLFYKVKHEE